MWLHSCQRSYTMHVNLEVTNFKSDNICFDSIKLNQEMSHDEFIEVVKYFEAVFATVIAKEMQS
jgi:hypothetical protein